MSGFDRGDRFERLQSDLLRAKAKIKKLEAELVRETRAKEGVDKCREIWIQRAKENRARAEKAESRVLDAKKVLANLRSQILVLMSQNRRSEARVAKLKDLINWTLGEGPTDTTAVLFPEKPDDWPRRPFYWRSALRVQFEAREREASE